MTSQRIVSPYKFIGLSTDTKPTNAGGGRVIPGSTFYETDTFDMYITRNGTNWSLKTSNVTLVDATGISADMFGAPTLMAQGNGNSTWERGSNVLSTQQKGGTGWVAKLSGGIQTLWGSAAEVYIPVKEMALIDLATATTMWSYFMEATEIAGVGMVVWVHDPDDFDKRAEISMLTEVGHMELAAGWNAHELADGNKCVWYGENTGTHDTTVTSGSPYNFSQYLTDDVFSTYTIYRISFAFGYQTTGVYFNPAYLADVKINGIGILLKPSIEEQLDIMRDDQASALRTIPAWTFGQPNLHRANSATAEWVLGSQLDSTYQKGNGWLAYLYGGVQSGDDYGSVNVPVNELPVKEFNSAMWSYYMSATEAAGVNIVIWIHDPTDFDKRCEVTQNHTVAGIERSAGWNAHEFNTATVQMFFYGENTTGADLTAGTNYAWTSFQDDDTLGTWTIYRVSIDYGWGSGATFDPAYLGELKLNGTVIPLGPPDGRHKKTVQVAQTMVADAKAAGDVVSSSAGAGVDWDFNMGGTGYIVKAMAMHDAAITTQLRLFLFGTPPTSELGNNVANTSPLTADAAFFLGEINFPAMHYLGTGDAVTVATPSTSGNLPLAFDSQTIYGILTTVDGVTTVAEALTITLTADMKD